MDFRVGRFTLRCFRYIIYDMPKTIAIVEDEPDQRRNYADALRDRGYRVDAYERRDEALGAFEKGLPDMAILDIVLGAELDGGFDICRALIAKRPSMPIIFLTDRVDETDKISGLRMGAWDYEVKPVSLKFLCEKVATLFRIMDIRNQGQGEKSQDDVKTVGALEIDEREMRITWQDKPVELTLTQFRIVAGLARRPGAVLTYDQLMESAMQSIVTNNTVNTHIRNIRQKFHVIDPGFKCIENVTALGYKWNCK